MPRLSDYPFDPRHEDRPDHFKGIHKVRAFKDEALRRSLFELYCNTHGEKIEPDEPHATKAPPSPTNAHDALEPPDDDHR